MKVGFLQEMMDETIELQIAPLIDCVFQLLIYFMVAASLQRTEADLGFQLPGAIAQAKAIQMPDEQMIEIDARGRVTLNNREYGRDNPRNMPDLIALLHRYRQAAEKAKGKALVTIQAADDTPHQRVVDVMNVCAAAGIKNVSFAKGEE
jgi:biopolymer transport protein ExbD